MRRSRSSSSIPMPFRCTSTSTSNRDSSASRPSYTRQASFESSARKRPMPTKLSFQARTSASTRTPQPSHLARASGSAQKSTQKRADIADKKLAADNHKRLQSWLVHDVGEVELAGTLHPPTITSFVRTVELLLQQFDPNIAITTANYKELVPKWLKLVGYAGNVPMSLLKCPNTSHNWPQVMNILGCILDIVGEFQGMGDYKPECVATEPNEFAKDLLDAEKVDCANENVFHVYDLFNNGISDSDIIPEFAAKINEAFEPILRVKTELEECLPELEHKLAKQTDLLDAKKNVIKKLEIDLKQLTATNEALSDDNVTLSDIELKIELQRALNAKSKQRLNEQNVNIDKLKRQLEAQVHPQDFKKNALVEIEEINNTRKNMQESIAVRAEIQVRLDKSIKELKKEIEDRIFHINNQLTQLSVWNPDLKLRLRVTGFFCEGFIDELISFGEQIARRKEDLVIQIKTNEERCAALQKQTNMQGKPLKAALKTIECVEKEIEALRNELKTVENECEQIVEEQQVQQEKIQVQIRQLGSEDLNAEIEQMNKRLAALKTDVMEMGQVREAGQKMADEDAQEFLVYWPKKFQEIMDVQDKNKLEFLTRKEAMQKELLATLKKLEPLKK